jgi:hypothetical protein
MSDIRNPANPQVSDFDSSDSGVTFNRFTLSQMTALGMLATLVFAALIIILKRIKQ